MKAHYLIRRTSSWTMLLIALSLTLSLATLTHAADISVGCDVDEFINAITAANSSPEADTLELSAGCSYAFTTVNNTDETYGPNGLPVITGELTLNGNGATITRAEGAPKFRFFQTQNTATLTLNQLTLEKGELEPWNEDIYDSYGGAIYNLGSLTLRDSVLQNNWADFAGGGIYNDGGSVSSAGSTFFNNGQSNHESAPSRGGAIFSQNGTMTINASEFTDNVVHYAGGAIFSQSGTMAITASEFTDNVAWYGGGAIFSEGSLSVEDSRFLGNSVPPVGYDGAGGAIYSGGTLLVTTSTFDGNSAMSYGGALSISGAATVSTSTFVRNRADGIHGGGGGGAIYGGADVFDSTFDRNYAGNIAIGAAINSGGTIVNSTFSSNTSDPGYLHRAGIDGAVLKNSIVYDTICLDVTDGGGNIYWPKSNNGCPGRAGNPKLGLLADNGGPTETMALGVDSAALNAAVDADCPSSDQRGVARPQGKHCDIGAFELEPPTAPILLLPTDNKKMTHARVNLRWEPADRVSFYHVLVRQDSLTGPKVVNLRVTPTNYKTPALEGGYWYYWRIKACSNAACTSSVWRRFRVK